MKNIIIFVTILLSATTEYVYARASNFHFILYNSSPYEITVTKVCKHNILDPCGSVVKLNPGEHTVLIAKQHHHGVGIEVDWQIVKRVKNTKKIVCASSLNFHLKRLIGVIWEFFIDDNRLSNQHKACDANRVTRSHLSRCGITDRHTCYKYTINIA